MSEPEKCTYAKVGGPPDWWLDCEIVDLDTEKVMNDVIEVNAAEGWAQIYTGAIDWPTRSLATKRIEGRFEIRKIR